MFGSTRYKAVLQFVSNFEVFKKAKSIMKSASILKEVGFSFIREIVKRYEYRLAQVCRKFILLYSNPTAAAIVMTNLSINLRYDVKM